MIQIDMEMPEDCFDCKKVYKRGCALYDRSNVRIGKRHPDCPLKSADEIPVLLDKAHEDGFKQGYLQAESDYKVQIDEMIKEIENCSEKYPCGWSGYSPKNIKEFKQDVLVIIHKYTDKE